ncbi:hypothetical protein LPJ78_000906 [Coemansia sp. RSA 989]|nr:hypothetical protein LPJ68_000729 [Coemansia sp. RSA 1086]KAJ1752899.1 hypothetical protein LPJ79_000886 [Coemansia sp. RSA 1821]KAJ1867496.1 hypothetical protein LPJ78_000906 [Coemansia sp. RSA 989]KAJ1875756.1 hypothetical protein LPJ55_000382 [Coemansia sp. RSA 990]KAJ2673506.1 hypothetical protein IWW42_002229 [Coemansia sp. RSA 1085]
MQGITTVANAIGGTPLVSLLGVDGVGGRNSAEILGKLEFMNPGGSIKDRVARHIVRQLTAKGIPSDALLVVAGPGNLAISLAMLGRSLLCLIPERTSADRINLLKAMGVTDIVRTLDGALPGSPEHPAEIAKRIIRQHPAGAYIDEESGEWDLQACYEELAGEIFEQTGGKLDALVLGVDTGNAATHLSQVLKSKLPAVQIVGVEPSNSAINGDATRNPLAHRWLCEDIGRAYPPRALSPNAVDMWIQVSDQIAYSMARRLIRAGVFAGPSAGAAVAAAQMYARTSLQPDTRIAVILSDSARNYTTTLLSDEWMLGHDLMDTPMLDDLQRKQHEQYRAASIEDLQLPAAITVSETDSMQAAISLMSEHDFSQVPVTGPNRRLIGYLTLAAAQTLIDNGTAMPAQPVGKFMLRFDSRSTDGSGIRKYWLITPETPLSELSKFFEIHSVAFVTDPSRKFCLGIATKQDLITFLARRNTHQF